MSPSESLKNYCTDERFLAPASTSEASIENVRFIVTEVELPNIYYNLPDSDNYTAMKLKD